MENNTEEQLWRILQNNQQQQQHQQQVVNQQPLFGNKRQPNKSPKKKFRYGPRDSLNSRNKIGKPGSRRFQLHHNEFFIMDNLRSFSDTEEEVAEWLEEAENELLYDNTTPLGSLVEDPSLMEKFAPFINISEEAQERLFELIEEDDSERCEVDETVVKIEIELITPTESFKSLPKPVRKLLKRYHTSEVVIQIDRQMMELSRDCEKTQHFVWNDGFQRRLAHGVSQYYCLHSYSKDGDDGRTTVVRKTKKNLTPLVPLVEFLKA